MQPKHARTKSTPQRVVTTTLIVLLLALGIAYWTAHAGSYTPAQLPVTTHAPVYVTTPPAENPVPPVNHFKVTTYTVRSGDTLWGISERMYHDPLRWRVLWQHNLKTVANSNLIYPGQVLQLE